MRRQGEDEAAELAALADGSLGPERRAAVEAHVAASPELQERLAEQKRSLSYTHGPLRTSMHRRDCAGASRLQRAPRTWAPVGSCLRRRGRRRRRRRDRRRRLALGHLGATVPRGALGHQLAPGASGSATLTKTSAGWRIELDASGLPRLDNGRFYEAWLKNAAGVLVPIGTFNEGPRVTLWAGVSPKDFPTLSVTRERADGDQTSSGEKVLVGPVDTSG